MKSYTIAAKELYLTQPTVSQHIAQLEEYIGSKVFDRTSKEVLLTREGEILCKFAKKIIALTDEAEQTIKLYKGLKSGHIVIGASTIPGEYIIPSMLGRFRTAYPGINSSIRIGDTEEIIQLLIDYSVDIGIVGAKVENRQIDYTPFDKDELIIIVPSNHKWNKNSAVSTDEIVEEPFVLREKGSGTRITFERAIEKQGVNPQHLKVTAEMGSSTAVKQAVKAGLGVSVISKKAVTEELKYKLIKGLTVKGVDLTRPFYVIQNRKRTQSPLCRAFVDFIKK